MMDHSADAEALFRGFARRHSFVIEKVNEPDIELLMRVPQQPGLSFELTLGLQNKDELNIGFQEFWSFFFPYEKSRQIVSDALDAIATGDCRLAVHTRWGGVVKRVLELHSNGRWRPIYSEVCRIPIPFVRTTVSYVQNEDARQRSTSASADE